MFNSVSRTYKNLILALGLTSSIEDSICLIFLFLSRLHQFSSFFIILMCILLIQIVICIFMMIHNKQNYEIRKHYLITKKLYIGLIFFCIGVFISLSIFVAVIDDSKWVGNIVIFLLIVCALYLTPKGITLCIVVGR